MTAPPVRTPPAAPQRRYGFLTSRRWIALIAGIVALSVLCVFLGYWQWTRHQNRVERVELVESNYENAPVPLPQIVPDAGALLPAEHEWQPVRVRGEYIGQVVVLPQRGIGGDPADHVLGVLAVDVGAEAPWLLLVDRGWYRTDSFADHRAAQELPSGPVDAVVRLRPAEPASPRVLGEGQIHRLNPGQAVQMAFDDGSNPEQVAAQHAGAQLTSGVYGQLASEEQGGASVLPAELSLLPRPAADLGSHLSYALQWWVFAVGCYVGLVVLARREAQAESDPTRQAPAPASTKRDTPAKPRSRRRRDDEEDEAIDAQLHHPRAGNPQAEAANPQARATSSA